MRYSIRVALNFVFLIGIIAILYSFAMFQGGFVSWFLFYSFLPIFLYYICLLVYPVNKWTVERDLSNSIVHAGDQVTLNITIKRKIPFPIHYCICEQVIPETMHKKDTRQKKFDEFHDPSLIRYRRQAKLMIFPWLRRTIYLTFDFNHVPRGEHEFKQFKVRTGDLFGFIKKEYTFHLENQLVVYPAERATHINQLMSSFDGGSVSSYMMKLKNTNVAVGVREYVAGDKFSWIDWKQTARQQEFMTKEFEQEKSVEMMIIFDGTYHDSMNPIAFEGAVELTLSLFEEIVKQSGQVEMLSLGKDISRYSASNSFQYREKTRQHLARIQPIGKKPLSMQLKEELMKVNSQYIFLLVTTVMNNEIRLTVKELRLQSTKVVVLYIQAKQLITKEEEKNMHLMRSQGIDICLLTEQQLKFDPIEVKF